MSDMISEAIAASGARPRKFRAATAESTPVRLALTLLALAGVGVLVVAPLATVFAEALAQGWAAAITSLGNHDAQSAIRLTLWVTAIALPLNAAFGIAANIAKVNLEPMLHGALGEGGFQILGVLFFAAMGLILYMISRKD